MSSVEIAQRVGKVKVFWLPSYRELIVYSFLSFYCYQRFLVLFYSYHTVDVIRTPSWPHPYRATLDDTRWVSIGLFHNDYITDVKPHITISCNCLFVGISHKSFFFFIFKYNLIPIFKLIFDYSHRGNQTSRNSSLYANGYFIIINIPVLMALK